MTRRTLIRWTFRLGAAGVAALTGCVSRSGSRGTLPPPGGSADPSSEIGLLSADETDDLIAFAEVLIERRTLAPEERRYLAEHIETRTRRSPGFLSLYRMTATVVDGLAGRPFAALGVRERIELIIRHRLAVPIGGDGEDPGALSSDIRTVRMRAIPDLIRGYYASPAGWAVVGYNTFPGRCGDLTRYTVPEA